LIPNPIHKVLSTLSTHEVQYLLMGGQACVFYGAAEFSRDCDVVILCESRNLERLQAALSELDAKPIAVPPLTPEYLQRGHAAHFRCQAPEAAGIRVDVMSKMRGVAHFGELWTRRTTLEDPAGARIELISLADLVAAKKTQRDKDWPMIRRLVEAHFSSHEHSATVEQIEFWLRESRTPAILLQLAAENSRTVETLKLIRPLLQHALAGDADQIAVALAEEEMQERVADREYWKPLRQELEELRRNRNTK
jgi:hypothetical protein